MTYKLFVASVLLQELGNIFQSAAYIKYSLDGIGFPRTKTLGELQYILWFSVVFCITLKMKKYHAATSIEQLGGKFIFILVARAGSDQLV
jgi:hypothetical protein